MTKKQAKAMRALIANGMTPVKALNAAMKIKPITALDRWEKIKGATRVTTKITGDIIKGTARFAGEALQHTAGVTNVVCQETGNILKGESEIQVVKVAKPNS